MSLYQIRARQGPHIKTYLISWQLFGPKISLEIHCWPITTFFKTVGENFSQCQIVLFCMMVSNCPILHDGVKLSQVSNCPRCQIVLLAWSVSNCPRCQIVRGVKLSHYPVMAVFMFFQVVRKQTNSQGGGGLLNQRFHKS